jgi:hypothetical protein
MTVESSRIDKRMSIYQSNTLDLDNSLPSKSHMCLILSDLGGCQLYLNADRSTLAKRLDISMHMTAVLLVEFGITKI